MDRRSFIKHALMGSAGVVLGSTAATSGGVHADEAYAWQADVKAKALAEGTTENVPLSWHQSDEAMPWNSEPDYYGSQSCFVMSILYLSRKIGARGANFGPVAFHRENKREGERYYECYTGPDNYMNVKGGAFENLCNTTSAGAFVEPAGSCSLAEVPALWEQNHVFYCWIAHAGHWVAVDTVKDGKVYIFDSSMEQSGPLDFAEAYGSGDFRAFKLLKGDVKTLPTVDNWEGGGATTIGGTEKVEVDENGIPKEYDLTGMVKQNYLYNDQYPIKSVPMVNSQEKNKIELIKERMSSDKPGLADYGRTTVSVLGYLVNMWAVLMLIGFLLDKATPLTDNKALSVMSLGRFKTGTEITKDTKVNGVRIVTTKTVFIIFGILVLIGALLASGVIYNLFYWIAGLFQ